MSGISRDDWLRACEEAGLCADDSATNDPNAITAVEFMQMFGVSRSTADHRLAGLVQKGKATQVTKRITTDYGRRVTCKAYRLLP